MAAPLITVTASRTALHLQPRSPARSGDNIENRQTSMAWRVLEKFMIYLLEIQNLKISSKITTISSHFFHLSIPVVGQITSSQNSYVEVLIPSASECDCIGDRIIKEAIKVIRVGPNPIWPMSLLEEAITANVKTERRWPPTGQREVVAPVNTLILHCQPMKLCGNKSCCLSHRVCHTLL